jgi:ArsR family transcriptional regulator
MNEQNDLSYMAGLYMALADKTRLRLLNLMRDQEVCVGYFTEVLGDSQPKISRHLAYLRNAGIVDTRRDGKWMHYRIKWPEDRALASVIDAALTSISNQEECRNDTMHLLQTYGRAGRSSYRPEHELDIYANADMNGSDDLESVDALHNELEEFLL